MVYNYKGSPGTIEKKLGCSRKNEKYHDQERVSIERWGRWFTEEYAWMDA